MKIQLKSTVEMSTDFFKEFSDKKKLLKVLILGAYFPTKYEDRLFKLKQCLYNSGYRNVHLVKDFPDEPSFHGDKRAHIVTKSKYHIKFWADVLLFVFFKDARNEGVSVEFEFACSNVFEKLSVSVVLSERNLNLSSMIMGSVEIYETKADTFEDELELCEKSIGYLTDFTHRLYWYL